MKILMNLASSILDYLILLPPSNSEQIFFFTEVLTNQISFLLIRGTFICGPGSYLFSVCGHVTTVKMVRIEFIWFFTEFCADVRIVCWHQSVLAPHSPIKINIHVERWGRFRFVRHLWRRFCSSQTGRNHTNLWGAIWLLHKLCCCYLLCLSLVAASFEEHRKTPVRKESWDSLILEGVTCWFLHCLGKEVCIYQKSCGSLITMLWCNWSTNAAFIGGSPWIETQL